MTLGVCVLVIGAGALIGLAVWYSAALVAATLIVAAAMAAWWNRSTVDRHGAALRDVVPLVLIAGVVVLGVIQVVPYGRAHSNPVPTGEPEWSSPRTRELMVGACYACHSNEVEWPWYSNVAPISWAVTDHVDEGRDAVNYSEFATRRGDADETIEVIQEGSMPPGYFTAFGLHPEAKLSDAEIDELIAGLRATPGLSEHGDDGDDDDD